MTTWRTDTSEEGAVRLRKNWETIIHGAMQGRCVEADVVVMPSRIGFPPNGYWKMSPADVLEVPA